MLISTRSPRPPGISVGSIYKYFDTKEDLFLTCVHFGVETLEAVLNEVIASPGDLFLKTEKIVRIIQTHSRDQKNLIILYNEMTSESNAKLTWKLAAEMEGDLGQGLYLFNSAGPRGWKGEERYLP